MRIPEFMIDTADLDTIERIWEKLNKAGMPTLSLRGITTNPNALDKIKCHTIKEFETTVYKLTRFLTRIGAKQATLHVQMPKSRMSQNELDMWVAYISQLGDGRTKLTMKISPHVQTLEQVRSAGLYSIIPLNVTGVSDAATALRCLTYPIDYVSIIPGRMEEVGINASAHLKFVNQRQCLDGVPAGGKIIAGSMRTIEGLRRSIDHQTIPTIGTRVWDAMSESDYLGFAGEWWDCAPFEANYLSDIPFIDQRNVDLTQQFFEQMDTLGTPLYDEFVNSVCK